MITTARLLSVGAWLIAALWLSRTAWDNPNIYDEGVVVVGALRLLDGDMPIRDFWTMYPPGVFLLFAGAFEVCGRSLVAERTISLGLSAALIACCFAMVQRRAGVVRAMWIAGLLTLWIDAGRLHASAVVPAMIFALVAVRLQAAAMETARVGPAIAAGICVGATALFRHDLAGYIFVATIATATVLRIIGAPAIAAAVRGPAASFAIAAVATLSIGVIGLAAIVGLDPLLVQLVNFPVTGFPEVRALPYPSPALAAGPVGLAAVAIGLTVRRLRAKATGRDIDALMLALAGFLFMGQSLVRSDFVHVLPAFVVTLTALGIALGPVSMRAAADVMVTVAVTALAVIGIPPPGEPPAVHRYTLTEARGLRSSADPAAYEQAVALVRQLAPPGARIFVGNDRHDRIFINDVLFYALADRRPATRYHELHPGVATTEPVQRAIVGELEAHQVSTVVIRTERHPPELANASSRSSGVMVLDEYLRSAFEPVARFGDYEIRRRR